MTYWDLVLFLLGVVTVTGAWWPDGLISEVVAEVEYHTGKEGLAILAGAVTFVGLNLLGLAFMWWGAH